MHAFCVCDVSFNVASVYKSITDHECVTTVLEEISILILPFLLSVPFCFVIIAWVHLLFGQYGCSFRLPVFCTCCVLLGLRYNLKTVPFFFVDLEREGEGLVCKTWMNLPQMTRYRSDDQWQTRTIFCSANGIRLPSIFVQGHFFTVVIVTGLFSMNIPALWAGGKTTIVQ